MSINLHNGVLGQSLGAHQLIAGSIIDHVENAGLLRAILRAPGKIASIDAESTILPVATAATHRVHALLAQFAQGRGTTHFKLALLLVDVPAATRQAMLVAGIA